MKLYHIISVFVFFVMSLALIGSSGSDISADQINPGVAPVEDKHYGLTYGDWSAKWWEWVLTKSSDENPLTDRTGERCTANQGGPVWFLGGTWGYPEVERYCTIPTGVAIFFPIYNGECSTAEEPNAKSYAELRNCVLKGNASQERIMSAKVDGVELKDLNNYRVESQLFNVTLPKNNVFGVQEGMTQAVADGWFIMLEPLSKGEHTIEFRAITINPNFQTHSTYHLTVE